MAMNKAEKAVAALAEAGGDGPEAEAAMKAARQELCLTCLPMAYRLAMKHARGGGGNWRLPKDDAEDVAREALCRAARRWDPALGFKFSTYAWRAINSNLSLAARLAMRRSEIAGMLVTAWNARREDPDFPEPSCPHGEEGYRAIEIRDEAEAALALLPPGRARLLRLLGEGSTHTEAAEALGVTRSRVGQLAERARRPLLAGGAS